MENASKALIIAGSILVAILIVTMGIFIISNTKGTSESAKKVATDLQLGAENTVDTLKTALESNEEREMREFNSKFDRYKGITNATGAETKQYISELQNIIARRLRKTSGFFIKLFKSG